MGSRGRGVVYVSADCCRALGIGGRSDVGVSAGTAAASSSPAPLHRAARLCLLKDIRPGRGRAVLVGSVESPSAAKKASSAPPNTRAGGGFAAPLIATEEEEGFDLGMRE